MSEPEVTDVTSEIYILPNRGVKVSQAKSMFAEEYDIPYSEVTGSKLGTQGYTKDSPAYCVVVHTDE